MNTRPSPRAGWSTFVIPSVLLVLCSTYAATADAQTTVIDLGTLGGSQVYGTGINDSGQVVGYSTLASGGTQGFIYNNGVMTSLGSLNGASGYSEAFAINSSGQVVGESGTATGDVNAFLYTNGVMQNIAPTPAGSAGLFTSSASAINDSGSVTGYLNPIQCSVNCTAFLYSNGTLTDLGLRQSIGLANTGVAITGSGAVVGNTLTPYAPLKGFVYNNGSLQYLTPEGTQSQAFGVNASGQVVGSVAFSNFTGVPFQAALFSNGSVQALGTLGGQTSSAVAINASGEIVGTSATATTATTGVVHAFVYADGHMADLNSLDTSSPLAMYVTLTNATAINDNGWIVADGVDSRTGLQHAYLVENPASPVPLPGALWLMLSGICGLGAYARKRQGLSAGAT